MLTTTNSKRSYITASSYSGFIQCVFKCPVPSWFLALKTHQRQLVMPSNTQCQ
ncbi:unnamed protein product, partial [Allacma fusca]